MRLQSSLICSTNSSSDGSIPQLSTVTMTSVVAAVMMVMMMIVGLVYVHIFPLDAGRGTKNVDYVVDVNCTSSGSNCTLSNYNFSSTTTNTHRNMALPIPPLPILDESGNVTLLGLLLKAHGWRDDGITTEDDKDVEDKSEEGGGLMASLITRNLRWLSSDKMKELNAIFLFEDTNTTNTTLPPSSPPPESGSGSGGGGDDESSSDSSSSSEDDRRHNARRNRRRARRRHLQA